ncbi:MAG TPA: GNAT family N-acetyltransferase [Candidatus Rifleibacterium sp.]|nr:GNAT family N-acetyltransferase [Candidatus Rifleibacterium sp.]HPT44355.1 GNAT family N-acetyltransferase [Candidatus Rifleibacterium sp.]
MTENHELNLKVLVATPADVNDLFAFEKLCFEHAPDQFPKRNLRHLITSPTSRTMIIRDEQGVIFATVTGLLRHFKVPSGRIYKIGVLPGLKKRGIGSFLIRTVEDWFRSQGMQRSCAEVRESNSPSRHMFEKNGYVETGMLYWFYAGGENAVKYWKTL